MHKKIKVNERPISKIKLVFPRSQKINSCWIFIMREIKIKKSVDT